MWISVSNEEVAIKDTGIPQRGRNSCFMIALDCTGEYLYGNKTLFVGIGIDTSYCLYYLKRQEGTSRCPHTLPTKDTIRG